MSTHEAFMRQAIAQAKSVWGTTHPNPMVGAVIVEQGQVVATGATATSAGWSRSSSSSTTTPGRATASSAR